MELQATLSRIYALLGESQKIAVSPSGPSRNPWTAIVSCTVKGEEIKVPLPEAFPINSKKKRLRLSFAAGPSQAGPEIYGDAIGKIEENPHGLHMIITPYRLRLIDAANDSGKISVLERRRNTWGFKQTTPAQTGVKFWLRALRAVSFPLSFFPITIGAALAVIENRFDWPVFILALIGGMAAHGATNLLSDYFDFVNGVDTTNALSSHTGVLVDELIGPDRILIAAMSCFLITAFCGGVLVAIVGWPVILFGLAGIAGGFLYSGGPFAWKYVGLGELSTGFLMGPLMVLGSFYVQMHAISPASILLSIAVGLLVSAVSWGNNIRDSFFDGQAGITTLPVKLGPQRALLFFRSILILPYAFATTAILIDHHFLPFILVFLTAPQTIKILLKMGTVRQSFESLSKRASEQILPLQVIRLHLRFCALVLVGCAIAKVLAGKI